MRRSSRSASSAPRGCSTARRCSARRPAIRASSASPMTRSPSSSRSHSMIRWSPNDISWRRRRAGSAARRPSTRSPSGPTRSPTGPVVRRSVILALPGLLRVAQRAFDETGGLHAAGLFSPSGELIAIREDVGRHNALDKLIGSQVLVGARQLNGFLLMVSGRVSLRDRPEGGGRRHPDRMRRLRPVRPGDRDRGTPRRHARRLPPQRRLQRLRPRCPDRPARPERPGLARRPAPLMLSDRGRWTAHRAVDASRTTDVPSSGAPSRAGGVRSGTQWDCQPTSPHLVRSIGADKGTGVHCPRATSATTSRHRQSRKRLARELKRALGRDLTRIRLDAGASHGTIAALAGIDRSHYSHIEAGTANPTLETLAAIAVALGGGYLRSGLSRDGSSLDRPASGPHGRDSPSGALGGLAAACRGARLPTRPRCDRRGPRSDDQMACWSRPRRILSSVDSSNRSDGRPPKPPRLDPRIGRIGPMPDLSRLLILRSTASTREIARMFESTLRAAYPARTADAVDHSDPGPPGPERRSPGSVSKANGSNSSTHHLEASHSAASRRRGLVVPTGEPKRC